MKKKRKRGYTGIIIIIVCFGFFLVAETKWKTECNNIAPIPYQQVEVEKEKNIGKYYYDSLSEKEKLLYQEILQGVLDGEKKIYLHSADAKKNNEMFQFVLNDYPEIFWCDGRGQTTIYQEAEEKYSVLVPEYQYNEKEREIKEREIESSVGRVMSEAPLEGTEYEKIKYVYEYVIDHTDYNESSEDNQNIYSVLVNGESVCAGYARTMQYLLEKMDVFCTYVTGRVKSPQTNEEVPHAWNLVSCGGDYYYVDATWGDPVYLEEVSPQIVYDYLCISEEELFKTHILDDTIVLPSCVAREYNYYVKNNMYYTTYDKDAIFKKMKESIQLKQEHIIFKFANEKVYKEANEQITDELIQDAAEYLGKLYQLSRVEYLYKEETILNKISISWKYN